MKKIAISQSNYIPWKGYFDLIRMADEFVVYDDVQYTRRDWRNRNKIKTPNGLKWLTIPVHVKGKFLQKINETCISDPRWSVEHWQIIKSVYAKAPYFKNYKDRFEEFYTQCEDLLLSEINFKLIKIVNEILGIHTKIRWSHEFTYVEGQTERLISICQQAGCSIYLSGPAARDYFNVTMAEESGIQVEWMDYSDYPQYRQIHPPFEHGVTILDLIFNEGPNATNFMKSFK